jgi:hypothetical protein
MLITNHGLNCLIGRVKDMRKATTWLLTVLITIGSGCWIYMRAGTRNAESMMWEYLEAKGYTTGQIAEVDVHHSFLNIALSYNEWMIKVRYVDEPGAVYGYTIRDGQIKDAGVSGSVDKEDLKHAH